MKKEKIAILTLHPYNYGGILSSLKIVYQFCEKYFEPTVFFLGFDREISANLKSFQFSSKVLKKDYFGMNCVEIGSRFAFWEPGHYRYTLKDWTQQLDSFKYFFVTAGTCISAHPLVLLNKKFPMWVASSYEEDKKHRINELSRFRFILDRLGAIFVRKIEKKILKRATFTWALSKYTQDNFENLLGTLPNNMTICGYPMDVKDNINYNLNSKKKSIIAVGRFDDPRKNISMLLSVFDKIYSQVSNVNLYVVGPKPSTERLQPFVHLKGFQGIVFTGLVSSKELDNLYKKAHLMLITSKQEGLGIIGLEAQSYAIPVISTNCGGPRDYILDGKNGYLVDDNAVEEMVYKAVKILTNEELAKDLSYGACEFIRQQCSYDKIYSIFKKGLIYTYPELCDYFIRSI